jgi:hypothetical protein
VSLRTLMIQSSLFVLAALPASAGPREDTLSGISRCATLSDDRTFLECVYGAAQPLRAKLGLPPARDAQIRLVPPATAALPQSTPSRADMPPAARQEGNNGGIIGDLFGKNPLHMVSYSFDPRGLFTVTLSNGEVWRQDPNDTNYAHWSGKAANYPVTVTPGEFGKSRLSVRGEPGPYRVERVR